MILKVSSTISSDTEDDFNSSTEAKGGGAIGLRNAASSTIAASESLTKDLSTAASTDSGLSSQKSSISSTDSDTTRSKYEASSSSEKNSSNDNQVTDVILKKVFKPRLSKNAEQIEALLRRINEENKKTKEVLDNLSQSGEVISKAPVPKNHFNKRLVDPQDLISDEEDQKTKDLVNAVIPPIRKPIIEKTSTTFLGMTLKKTSLDIKRMKSLKIILKSNPIFQFLSHSGDFSSLKFEMIRFKKKIKDTYSKYQRYIFKISKILHILKNVVNLNRTSFYRYVADNSLELFEII